MQGPDGSEASWESPPGPDMHSNPCRLAGAALVALAATISARTALTQTRVLPVARASSTIDARATAFDGNTLVVGRPGLTYVYELTNQGTFAFVANLNLVTPPVSSSYGYAVDIEGDMIAVADLGDYEAGVLGRVYVYRELNGAWSLEARLPTTHGEDPLSAFGSTLSISEGRIAVGQPANTNSSFGHVILFERPPGGGGWGVSGGFDPLSNVANNGVGSNFVLDGDTFAMFVSTRASVFVYRNVAGVGWQLLNILHEDGTVGDGQTLPPAVTPPQFFGGSVAVSGDTVFLGESWAPGQASPVGTVRVFRETSPGSFPGTYAFAGWLRASDNTLTSAQLPGQDGAAFGTAVDASGDWLVVGSRQSQLGAGVAYLFERDSSTAIGWRERVKFVGAETPGGFYDRRTISGDRFVAAGYTVASGSVVMTQDSLALISQSVLGAYCHADGGLPAGCSVCPCQNTQPPAGAGGCLNSRGLSARLAITGVPSLQADSLRLEIAGAAPDTFALLVSGSSPAPSLPSGPCPTGSGSVGTELDGLICTSGATTHLATLPTDEHGAVGFTNAAWGSPGGGLLSQGAFAAGQVVHFQVVYRDGISGGGACGRGANTSNALRVVVLP